MNCKRGSTAVAGTPDAPDVLVGTPLPQLWSEQNSGLVRAYGLVTLGVVNLIPQTESGEHARAGWMRRFWFGRRIRGRRGSS